jgi:3-oxoacyl-[acyl-carrier protein] reductase
MELELTDNVAIVTGASRGLGRAIAIQLAGEGMRLVLAARSQAQLEETAALCGGPARCLPCDLREPEAPARLVDFALAQFGALDLLVNNAGATQRGDFLRLDEAAWQDGFALKFFGAMRCARAAWPHLAQRRGAIVNIIGIGGRTGSAEFAIGGAVNAALMNLTKVLADRGVADGVRVNAINPGSIATDRLTLRIARLAEQRGLDPAQAGRQMAAEAGVARFGDPAEIGAAVAFLASARAGYCQGAILDIDGGQTRTL